MTADQDRLRVVLAHDQLAQRGGAERVALLLAQSLTPTRFITSVYNRETTYPEFSGTLPETFWLQHVPAFRKDPRLALPFLKSAWSQQAVRASDGDVLLCSSSGWAHGLTSEIPKVVYCYNPARWLYQPDSYLADQPRFVREAVRQYAKSLRRWDAKSAQSASRYIAISRVVQSRIHAAYGITADVLHPPVTLSATEAQQPIAGVEPGFFLTVGRPRTYKHTDLVCEAVARHPSRSLVVVGGLPEGKPWPDRLVGLSDVPDASMRWLYANCSAVIGMSEEDFGLTPLEGYVFGKPAITVAAGGYLDSMVEGVTGQHTPEMTADSLDRTLGAFNVGDYDPRLVREYASRFEPQAFIAALLQTLQSVAGQLR